MVPETVGTIGRNGETPDHIGKRTLGLSAGSLVSVPAILSLHCRTLQVTCAWRSLFKMNVFLPFLTPILYLSVDSCDFIALLWSAYVLFVLFNATLFISFETNDKSSKNRNM